VDGMTDTDFLARLVRAFDEAMDAELVPGGTRKRIANRVIYGMPEGPEARFDVSADVPAGRAERRMSGSQYAEVLHAEHHPGTFVPTLDSCREHERADYEALAAAH
jgi:hypothetical protein